jgi:hypothetical protein
MGELVWLAMYLAGWVVLAAALLFFVPRRASRAWATGLLVFVALGNLAPIIGGVVASFSPPRVYLQTEKDGLEFNRDESGKVFGVWVNHPPPEILTYLQSPVDRTWANALATITLTLTALGLWRRAALEPPGMANADVADSPPRSAAGVCSSVEGSAWRRDHRQAGRGLFHQRRSQAEGRPAHLPRLPGRRGDRNGDEGGVRQREKACGGSRNEDNGGLCPSASSAGNV